MSQPCKKGCGRQTGSKSGICIICEKFTSLSEELSEIENKRKCVSKKSVIDIENEKKDSRVAIATGNDRQKESGMARNNKKCKQCGTEATSNRAETCLKCGASFEVKVKSPVTAAAPGEKKETKTQMEKPGTRNPGPRSGTDQKQDQSPESLVPGYGSLSETYIIPVDFSRYPKLHERLVEMSEIDFRTPGMQLLSLVHGTLTKMEAEA